MIIQIKRDNEIFYITGDTELTKDINDNVFEFESENEAREYAAKWWSSFGKTGDVIGYIEKDIMCKVIITTFNFNWRYDKRYEFLMEKKKTFDFWNEVFCNNGGGFIGGYIRKMEIYENNEQIFVWEKNNG